MNFSSRQLKLINSQVSLIAPATIAICDGFAYRQIQDYLHHFQCHVKGSRKPLLIIETNPCMSVHPIIRWQVGILGFDVKHVAHIQRDDEGGCASSVNLWLINNKQTSVESTTVKSCLNCLMGEFHPVIDSGLYSYSGECCHFERGIREQVFPIIEVESEYLVEVEQMFERVGQECPVWEPKQ
ncbi:hypothetical protein [Nostoc sp.]|uniref:hypothetical protein n=1 Tax=Nostoc sp. TaxID=1180 RepID=UPI002FFB52A6